MRWILAAASVILTLSPGLFAQCEPALPVREILERAWEEGYKGLPQNEVTARRQAMYRQGLEAHADDPFLWRMMLVTTRDRKAALALADAQRRKHPGRAVYELLYARTLAGHDTPEALRILDRLKVEHPELPQAHLMISDVVGFGRWKDTDRAKAEVAEYIRKCPAPLDSAPLRSIAQHGTGAQRASVAAAVRKRIAAMPLELMAGVWEALWALEFNATPPNEHATLRARIAADLERLAQVPGRGKLRWLEFLRGGYESAGKADEMRAVEEEILHRYPRSEAAKQQIRDRWMKEHPYPRNAPAEQLRTYAALAAKTYADWSRRWPDDSLIYYQWFTWALELPETKPEQVARMGDELMAMYRANPNWWGFPPVELKVADAFVTHKVNLTKVPALLDEGFSRSAERDRDTLNDDRMEESSRASMLEGAEARKLERARILLAYCAATGNPELVRSIEAELSALAPAKPAKKASVFEYRAQAAELLGRKLDALLLYRAALTTRPGPPAGPGPDSLRANVERLWKELGGTGAAQALLLDQGKPAESVTDSRWEKPPRPLPPFSVPDLEGKTWTLAALEGKVVLINVWATWCGPCRAEHPEFQKLEEQLKARPGVAVISFNVDDDLSKVAPYMAENKYTFPVLLAKDVVNQVLTSISIPQNWYVTRTGKLEAIQVGYGGESNWREMMIAKLDEIAGAK